MWVNMINVPLIHKVSFEVLMNMSDQNWGLIAAVCVHEDHCESCIPKAVRKIIEKKIPCHLLKTALFHAYLQLHQMANTGAWNHHHLIITINHRTRNLWAAFKLIYRWNLTVDARVCVDEMLLTDPMLMSCHVIAFKMWMRRTWLLMGLISWSGFFPMLSKGTFSMQ